MGSLTVGWHGTSFANFGNMLEEIRNGVYFPDCTRSGRLVNPKASAGEKSLGSVPGDKMSR